MTAGAEAQCTEMRPLMHVRPESVMALLWQVNVVSRPVLTKALKYVGAAEDKILLVEDHDEFNLDEPLADPAVVVVRDRREKCTDLRNVAEALHAVRNGRGVSAEFASRQPTQAQLKRCPSCWSAGRKLPSRTEAARLP